LLKYLSFVALCGALVSLTSSAVRAQSFQDVQRVPLPVPAERATAADPFVAAGPVIYVCDTNHNLWTVTLGTYKLHKIGNLGVYLTDIAFNPKDGKLWGVSFTTFYTVNTSTGKATPFGSTSLSDINALVFDKTGVGYFEGFSSSELYEAVLDVAKPYYKGLGATGAYKSAGDLTFYNGALVLAGFTGSLGSSTKETLVQLNDKDGKVVATAPTDVELLYGLSTIGGNALYGFANTSLYRLYPSEKNIKARAVLLKNFASEGLKEAAGAAYKGDT
jgi:hypothetical protein